jgi:DNA-binding NtrC family response regulator
MLSPILFISDSNRYKSLFYALSDLGIKVVQLGSEDLDLLRDESAKTYTAAIIERGLHSQRGTEALKVVRNVLPNLPLVVLSSPSAMTSEERVHNGEFIDLLVTGDEMRDLSQVLDSLKRLLPELQAQVLAASDLLPISTPNEKMKRVLTLVDIIKDEPSSVLIQGENGTGKEVIARLLHFSGRRHVGQFVAINCAAIPETLLESELFGHEKGAFTGATEKRIGKFELAHRGTAFLDEIGDMPLSTQAKILRVLESGEIERVGGHEKIPVDIRVLAATNKNLLQQIEKSLFRQDLYYRINTFSIHLPPLRERPEDILPMARYFIDIFSTRRSEGQKKRLSEEVERLLLSHEWPGNVRELRNAMERAMVLAAGGVIEPQVLPDEIRFQRQGIAIPREERGPAMAVSTARPAVVPLKELERKAIIEALSRLDYNATKTAAQLGISRATLFRKLKEYGISRRLTLQT